MIIAFLKENDEYERRSMLLPEHISPITKLGFKVLVENGYAEKLNIDDKFYIILDLIYILNHLIQYQ